MPIEIKKVCKALATLWEISDNMENYLDQKGKSLDIFFKNCETMNILVPNEATLEFFCNI